VGLEASVLAEVNGVAGQPREGKRGIALTTTTTTTTTIRESVQMAEVILCQQRSDAGQNGSDAVVGFVCIVVCIVVCIHTTSISSSSISSSSIHTTSRSSSTSTPTPTPTPTPTRSSIIKLVKLDFSIAGNDGIPVTGLIAGSSQPRAKDVFREKGFFRGCYDGGVHDKRDWL